MAYTEWALIAFVFNAVEMRRSFFVVLEDFQLLITHSFLRPPVSGYADSRLHSERTLSIYPEIQSINCITGVDIVSQLVDTACSVTRRR